MARIAFVLSLVVLTVGPALAARIAASSGKTVEIDGTAQLDIDAAVKPAKLIHELGKKVRPVIPGKAVWFPHTGPKPHGGEPRPQSRPEPPRQPIPGKAVWFPHTGPRPQPVPQPPSKPMRPSYPMGAEPAPAGPKPQPLVPTGTEPALAGPKPQPPGSPKPQAVVPTGTEPALAGPKSQPPGSPKPQPLAPGRRILPSHVRPYVRPPAQPQPPSTLAHSDATAVSPSPSPDPPPYKRPSFPPPNTPYPPPIAWIKQQIGKRFGWDSPPLVVADGNLKQEPNTPSMPQFTSPLLVVADGNLNEELGTPYPPPFVYPPPGLVPAESPLLVVADGNLKQEPNTPYPPPFQYQPRPNVAFADGNPAQLNQEPNTPYPPPFTYPERPNYAFADGNLKQEPTPPFTYPERPNYAFADGNLKQEPQSPETPYIFQPEYPPQPAPDADAEKPKPAPNAEGPSLATNEDGIRWSKLPVWPQAPHYTHQQNPMNPEYANVVFSNAEPQPSPSTYVVHQQKYPPHPAPNAERPSLATNDKGIHWSKQSVWPQAPHYTHQQNPMNPEYVWSSGRHNGGPNGGPKGRPAPGLMAGAALVAGSLGLTTEPPLEELHTLEYGPQAPTEDTAGGLHHADQSGDDLPNPDFPSNLQAPAWDNAASLQAEGVLNVGDKCGGACDGGPCRFCGTGFCCKKGSFRGGCDGLSGGSHYVCTGAPRNATTPMNMGKECWNAADCRSGQCGYCGSGLCCRMGVAEGGCDGSVGGIKAHQCVAFQAFRYDNSI